MRKAESKNLSNKEGITLVELLVTLTIFGIVLAVVFAAYVTQIKHGTREYRIAESDMELEISKAVIERDLAMTGYGFADDYAGFVATTVMPISATNANPDTLTLRGLAIGRDSRAAQAWTYMASTTQFRTWTGAYAGENIRSNDRVIYMEPATKTLRTSGGNWSFTVGAAPNSPITTDFGILVYGVATEALTQPFYTVRHYLGGASPSVCAPGTQSLLRAESNVDLVPAGGEPLLACVRDFQVAFGLDTNENGSIDCWDNGGATAAGYSLSTLKARLKQVKAYVLVQLGNVDRDYRFPTNPVRVGDINLTACAEGGGVGRDVTLTAEQLNYRWRLITVGVTPRNMR